MRGYLVVDHGSRRAASNAQLGEVADHLRELLPNAPVAFAHMEIAAPTIADGIAQLVDQDCSEVLVLLYFLSDGRHVTEDVPELVEEACKQYPNLRWRIGRSLGPDPALSAQLLRRAGVQVK